MARPAVGAPAKVAGKATSKEVGAFWLWLPSLVGFCTVFVLLAFVYGDVLWRVEQNSYVSADAVQMKHLTDVSMGWMFYAGRWVLTLLRYPPVGGAALALLLVACSMMLADVMRVPRKWAWAAHLVSFAFFAWLLYRGFNLYYRSEPSWVVLIPTWGCLLLTVATLIGGVLPGKRPSASSALWRRVLYVVGCVVALAGSACTFFFLPWPAAAWLSLFIFVYCFAIVRCVCLVADRSASAASMSVGQSLTGAGVLLLLGIVSWFAAYQINDSVIATARMQRLMEEQDWEAMCQSALKLDRPTRSVAAYYALALEHQDALLEGLFDLPFDFPKVKFDEDQPADEYTLFNPDCDLAAGLVNSAYHEAFELTVMSGLRLHWLKTMAKAAVLNGEERLARKYIAILRANPFEGEFCDRIEPMISDTTLIAQDNELSHVLQMSIRDRHPFEQLFRKPVFLGYNMGLTEGPDAVLRTSAAACLYSKDLNAFVPRAQIFMAKRWPLPDCMQQALVIYSLKHGGADFLKQFQGAISPMTEQTIAAFSRDVAPFTKDKEAMRRELKKDWLGTYVYYYYCENNNPEQVRKQESAGVN